MVHPETGQLPFKVNFKAGIDPQEQHLGPEKTNRQRYPQNSTYLVSCECNEDNLDRAQYVVKAHENSGRSNYSVVHYYTFE